ncbi:hypothetical protein F5Y14DRAFT_439594 [Nemania sp. NC0429]|nr:hypothetical protein F5Y14DRAFT_439594 [Nemania sp. NC0429]
MSDTVIPFKLSRDMPRSLEAEPFVLEFETKIPNLFSTNADCRVGLVEYQSSPNGLGRQIGDATQAQEKTQAIQLISLEDQINSLINAPSFLHRYNSWSRIDITIEMFQALYTTTCITPQFLKIVSGLGRKMGSRDECFMSCYTHLTCLKARKQGEKDIDEEPTVSQLGICYNIRHFERHGRSLEDPWSCRQSAIHHNYNIDQGRSDWIFIQPPLSFNNNFQGEFISDSRHPMYLHLRYLVSSVGGWREYLNHIYNDLKELNEEIAVCKPYGEFGIGFSSRQQVHNLRLELHHARSILANTLNTIKTIRAHEETTAKLCKIPIIVHQDFQRELENIVSELQNHEQTVQELLSVSNDIGLMYDGVLKYHGQELLHNNSLRLTQIAQNDAFETRTMAAIAEKTFHDSRTVRIATVIAMFYLPANLVTSFFSTTLIWFDNSGQNFALKIRPEAWIAVVTTLVLVGGTKFLSWWWEQSERKKHCATSVSQSQSIVG